MEWIYTVHMNGTEYAGAAELSLRENRSSLLYAEYEASLTKDVAAVICEEKEDGGPVSKCWIEVRNASNEPVRISKLSAGFKTSPMKGMLHYFSSSWGKEFTPHDIPIPEQFRIGSLTGRSSEEYSPWVGIESDGAYYGFTLAWSGNWSCEIHNRNDGFTAAMGIHEDGFFSDIAPKERLTGAPVYLAHSPNSLDEASRRLRRYFIRHDSIVDPALIETLPVTYNTWWCYEDRFIHEGACLENAHYASEAGMTQFILDAGWFGIPHQEVNWFGKRGDWEVENRVDFPSGLSCLGKAVTDTGIPFGIWCEIEAIGDIAKLHDTHPELVAKRDGESLGYLCMANPQTRKWAMKVIDRLVTNYHATWIKFDFNVSPHLGCNAPGHSHGQGDGLYHHYQGYYEWLREVHKKYPALTIENCGSGGMRNDLGILSRAHFAYLSDHDYVDNHFQCLWGATSFIHPALCYQFTQSECVSDHNGIFDPITEDITPTKLDFYIRASLLSTCGFSYRFANWKPEWLERLHHYIAFFKYFSKKYILLGEMYRLTGQALRGEKGDRWQAYQYLAEDHSAYVFAFRLKGGEPARTIYLQGLDENALYDVTFDDCKHRITRLGKSFMTEGICLSHLSEEGSEIIKVAPGR